MCGKITENMVSTSLPPGELSHTKTIFKEHCTLQSQPGVNKFEYWATLYDAMVNASKQFDSESSPDIYDHPIKVKIAKFERPIAQIMGRWGFFSTIDKFSYRHKRHVVHRWFSDHTIKKTFENVITHTNLLYSVTQGGWCY